MAKRRPEPEAQAIPLDEHEQAPAGVVELPGAAAEVVDEQDEEPTLGEPFAIAIGCDMLPLGPGVPGCWACVRCDCGKAFKVDLLSEGVKRCHGCGLGYSHVLLVAPHDDPDIVAAFDGHLDGGPDDDDDQGDDDQGDDQGDDNGR
jgi:hypothetical protein